MLISVVNKCAFGILAMTICSIFLPEKAHAWLIEGRWSTAKFDCLGNLVKIGVDMNSRIGGGDAAPVRKAYIYINGNMSQATWNVGASVNTIVEKGEGSLKLSLANSGTFLETDFAPRLKCKPIIK